MRDGGSDKVWNFSHLIFGFVSDFGIRISSFLFLEKENEPFKYSITSRRPMRQSNFFIGQIAGRIRGPHVTGGGFRTDSEITGANIQPAAGRTSAFNVFLFLFKFFE